MKIRSVWIAALFLVAIGIILVARYSSVQPGGDVGSRDVSSAESIADGDPEAPAAPGRSGETIAEGLAGAKPLDPGASDARAVAPAVNAFGVSSQQPLVEAVFDALHEYRIRFKENPVGNNAEITAALMGKNPDEANLVTNPGLKTNEARELVDEWGTPFFLHQLSGTEMEIRSAGADRRMWTADDKKHP